LINFSFSILFCLNISTCKWTKTPILIWLFYVNKNKICTKGLFIPNNFVTFVPQEVKQDRTSLLARRA
jgi:hypothetical protein